MSKEDIVYDNIKRIVGLAKLIDTEISVLRHSTHYNKERALKDLVTTLSTDCHQLLKDLEELIDVQKD